MKTKHLLIIIILMSYLSLLTAARANSSDPILVIYNSNYPSNPFGLYLGEILRAEGLNAYTTFDVFNKTGSELATELSLHELAILAETSLTADQATALTNYVSGGGRLIAMRPDTQIKSLFGLGSASGNLANGYVKIQTTATWNGKQPGSGLASQPLQIHGVTDQYTLGANGVMLAELYNGATPTGYPAVIGQVSGRTAAFTYDLVRNVIYTRQGNPSNADIDTDGDGTFRTIDLFQASGGGNPWIDRNLIPIPQADEQQRLLARLIKQMIAGIKPMPQLWYLPATSKTGLVLTGDAHNNPTAWYQSEIDSLNAHGGKITIYLSSLFGLEPYDVDVQAWRLLGHEFGIHPWPYKDSPEINSLSDGYYWFDYFFGTTYSSPKSRTVRNHMIAWEGWTSAAELAVTYGISLDTNFYHWGAWLQKPDGTWPHGYITGSGQPMKFIRQDGTIINNYQLLTELVDEQFFPGTGSGFEQLNSELASLVSYKLIDSSLINDYAALMTQFHVDYYSTTYLWAENTLDFARTRGVAVSNADTFLAFTEARNAAKFSEIAWNSTNNTLTFELTAPTAPSYYLTVILPLTYDNRTLASVSVDSTPANFSIHTIKGEVVAFVSVPSGNHTFLAAYQSDSGILTHTTYADFTPVCATSNGVSPFDQRDSLILSVLLHDYFDGASLDGSRWSSGSWSGGSYTPVVSGGLLTLPGGGWVRSLGTYTRAIVDATAQFGNGPWQHIGFAYDGFAQDRYIIFSTFTGDGNLYARVNNQTGEQNINLGPIPSGFHRYRVVWEAVDGLNDRANFYIDDALQAQFTFAKAGNENLYFYLSNNGSADLVIDYAQVFPPYTASGTFTSCALDAGLGKEWKAISWDAFAGEGNLTVEARTSSNGSTWTGWSTITSNGGEPAVKNRYIQYRLTLSTAYPNYTPEVNSVSLLYESSVPLADISVSKTDNQNTVVAGSGQQTYTIVVSNAGPANATNVTLTDTWPAAFTRGTVTTTQGTCSGSPSFTCNLGTLIAGNSATITVAYTVPANTPAGDVTNAVSVSTSSIDPDSNNNNASDTNTVVRSINLGVAKSDGVASVTAGDGVQRTYTITVNNAGPSDASGVTLSDTWPSAFTRGAVTPSQGTCFGSPNFTCSLGVLASGGSATVTVSYTVPPSAPAGSATNSVSVSANETDSNPANNSASDINTVVRSINLGVAKSDGVASVTAGDGVQRTYTITVNNAGPSDASTVILSDTWPAAFTRGTVSASQGNCSGYPDFTCSLQTIASGASATITVNYTVPANTPAGSVTNSVSVSANETDSDPQDNSATDSTLVITSADLSLTKVASSSILQVGSTLVFTVTVSNEGPSVANGVVVQDALPSGYTFVQAETTRGGYSNTTGLWTIGAISPGESLTLRLELVIKSTGEFDNYAQVYASSTPDPDSTPGNDSQTEDDDAFVFMGTFADLSLSMTASKTASFVGDQLIFTLVLVNSGPSPALQVQVKDILPSGYTLLNSSATLGAYSSLDGIWTVGNLNAGSTAVLNLAVKVNAAPGQYLNQAEVWSTDTPDPDSIPGNSSMIEDDEASVDVTVNFIFLPVVTREP